MLITAYANVRSTSLTVCCLVNTLSYANTQSGSIRANRSSEFSWQLVSLLPPGLLPLHARISHSPQTPPGWIGTLLDSVAIWGSPMAFASAACEISPHVSVEAVAGEAAKAHAVSTETVVTAIAPISPDLCIGDLLRCRERHHTLGVAQV